MSERNQLLPLSILLLFAGCASFVPEAKGRKDRRAEPAVPVIWPERYAEPLEEIAARPMPEDDSKSGSFGR